MRGWIFTKLAKNSLFDRLTFFFSKIAVSPLASLFKFSEVWIVTFTS